MKNYTSTVPATTSMALVEKALVHAGATHISKAYEQEQVVGFYFQFVINGIPVAYRLPVKVKAVHDAMERGYARPDKIDQNRLWAQAARTAWKILYDWILVQLSMMEMEQALPMEIFLPYALMPARDETVFEVFQSSGFKQLEAPK